MATATKVKHTPGPWTAQPPVESERRTVYIKITHGKQDISITGVYGKTPDGTHAGRNYTDRFGTDRTTPVIGSEECAANARLIAAAPDLLSALNDILASYEANDSRGIGEAIEASRAAIKQAEGQS